MRVSELCERLGQDDDREARAYVIAIECEEGAGPYVAQLGLVRALQLQTDMETLRDPVIRGEKVDS